ncbi:MAG: shikimate kinase [Planctomycetes bacterium]|nr:shikimate kinase [Planctomycetota bacterium]
MSTPRRTLALVGLRCSGKSSVGARLAALLGVAFVDLDERVRAFASQLDGREYRHAGDVLAASGVARFRELEALALTLALERGAPSVLATGGGVVERADNRSRLTASCFVVRLDAPLEVLAARLAADPTPRPALVGGDPLAELAELRARRAAWYAEVAHLALDTGRDSIEVIASRLAAQPDVRTWTTNASSP